jgi:hypothetical protein
LPRKGTKRRKAGNVELRAFHTQCSALARGRDATGKSRRRAAPTV